MTQVAFRPFAEEDLALLFNWLGRPHVRRWWGSEPRSFLEVAAKYGPRAQPEDPVAAFVLQVDGADAGYAQAYALADFPAYRELLGIADAAGVMAMDLFIADEWRTGRGLGAFAIRRFAEEKVFARPEVRECLAGPQEGDAGAIRAFENAGFHRWKVVANERGVRECVMRRERDTGTYRIEPIREADLAACARLRREMYRTSFGTEAGLEEEMGPGNATYYAQLRAKMAQLPEGNAHLWRDGQIVGQLEMRLLEDEPDVLYLSLIHVDARWRGHGHGKRLHAHAMEVARRLGKKLMRLSVANSNATATRFYRRLGWVVVGSRPNLQPMSIMEIPVR